MPKIYFFGQMGEGFGMAVAACDVDGDNLDDLIVGSPLYRCLPLGLKLYILSDDNHAPATLTTTTRTT